MDKATPAGRSGGTKELKPLHPKLGRSTALEDASNAQGAQGGVKFLTADVRDALNEAIEALAEAGLWDPKTQRPRPGGRLGPIDAGISSWPELTNPRLVGGELIFRPAQCEALLNQGAALLETCLAERAGYDALREKHTELWLAVQAFLLEDNILEQELASEQRQRQLDQAGHYVDRASAEATLQEEVGKKHTDALEETSAFKDGDYAAVRAKVERARTWSPYLKTHEEQKGNGWVRFDALGVADAASTNKEAPDWMYEAVDALARYDIQHLRHDLATGKSRPRT